MISCFIQLLQELHGKEVDGCTILVEYEAARSLKGWIPRRLGKGYVFICLNNNRHLKRYPDILLEALDSEFFLPVNGVFES